MSARRNVAERFYYSLSAEQRDDLFEIIGVWLPSQVITTLENYENPDVVFEKGYDTGYAEAEEEHKDDHDDGYESGHEDGYDEGYEEAKSEAKEGVKEAYKEGYSAGFDAARLEYEQ